MDPPSQTQQSPLPHLPPEQLHPQWLPRWQCFLAPLCTKNSHSHNEKKQLANVGNSTVTGNNNTTTKVTTAITTTKSSIVLPQQECRRNASLYLLLLFFIFLMLLFSCSYHYILPRYPSRHIWESIQNGAQSNHPAATVWIAALLDEVVAELQTGEPWQAAQACTDDGCAC